MCIRDRSACRQARHVPGPRLPSMRIPFPVTFMLQPAGNTNPSWKVRWAGMVILLMELPKHEVVEIILFNLSDSASKFPWQLTLNDNPAWAVVVEMSNVWYNSDSAKIVNNNYKKLMNRWSNSFKVWQSHVYSIFNYFSIWESMCLLNDHLNSLTYNVTIHFFGLKSPAWSLEKYRKELNSSCCWKVVHDFEKLLVWCYTDLLLKS